MVHILQRTQVGARLDGLLRKGRDGQEPDPSAEDRVTKVKKQGRFLQSMGFEHRGVWHVCGCLRLTWSKAQALEHAQAPS